MSRGQLPRTPANFPRMKHRAAGRLARKRARQRPQSVFAAIGKAFNGAIDSLAYAFTSFARAFKPPTQADFALTPPPLELPMIAMTRPQDWAPVARSTLWPEQRR